MKFLNSLSPREKKIFLLLAGIVGIFGVYVYLRRGSSGASSGGNVVTPAQDNSNLLTAIQQALSGLASQQQQQTKGLADLIVASDQHTVDALNAQTASYLQSTGDLLAGEKTALQALSNAIGAGFTNVSGLFTQLTTLVTKGFGDLTTLSQSIASEQAKQTTALNGLIASNTSAHDAENTLLYQVLGQESGASCITGNNVSKQCIYVKAQQDLGGNDTQSDAAIRQYYTNKYPSCWDGSKFDLICVGKKIAGVS